MSSLHALGIHDLIVKVESYLSPALKEHSDRVKFVVVGKPNVGKSTLVNQLIGDKRIIVDDLPGTTRDAIDVPFKWEDREFMLVDTAGMRREKNIKNSVEYFSVNRALKSVRSAEIVLLLIDTNAGLTRQDVDILGKISFAGKGCVIGFNKWDLTEKIKKDELFQMIENRWPHLQYYPKLTLSALQGDGLEDLMRCLIRVYENCQNRISTPRLNKILASAYKHFEPPACRGKMLRIYYVTQVGVMPPEFVLFVNDKELLSQNYLSYLEHQIREHIDLLGVPLRIRVKRKKVAS